MAKKRIRMCPIERKQMLLETAVSLTQEQGIHFTKVKWTDIASLNDVSVANVFQYFKTRQGLEKAILDYAGQNYEQNDCLNILVQALVCCDPRVNARIYPEAFNYIRTLGWNEYADLLNLPQ